MPGLQLFELGARGVIAHDGDALEPPSVPPQGVEQTAVVEVVAGVWPDNERMSDAVGIECLHDLRRGADLRSGGSVERVGRMGNACRVKNMVVQLIFGSS
jgi:hypothetical protein